eukprot:g38485.t1
MIGPPWHAVHLLTFTFQVGHYDIASDWDLGAICFVELQVTPFIFQDYWFCCCVTVEAPEGNTFHFPCYKWLDNCTISLREGT